MSEYKNPIIVPWDFSDKSEFALEHALNYSAISGKDIALVHIVKKSKEIVKNAKKSQKITPFFLPILPNRYKPTPQTPFLACNHTSTQKKTGFSPIFQYRTFQVFLENQAILLLHSGLDLSQGFVLLPVSLSI